MNAPIFGTAPVSRFQGPQAQPVPAGAQALAVGACPPAGLPQSTWGGYNPPGPSDQQPWAPWTGATAPMRAPSAGVPPSMFANELSVLRQGCAPLGLISEAAPGIQERVLTVFPQVGRLYGFGLKSCNGCFELILTRLVSSGSTADRLGGPIDPGFYNTTGCMCCFDFGCISRDSPVSVTFRSFTAQSTLPVLNMGIVGIWDQAWNACDPGLAAALISSGALPFSA